MANGIADADLAAAIEGRDHWQAVDEATAVYEPPGMPASVRVGRIARPALEGPGRHDRYYGAVIQKKRAVHHARFGFARSAVEWAERVRLT